MNNTKEFYYKLIYTKSKKEGRGVIKIKLDFNERFMSYEEIDTETGHIEKMIHITGYDYDFAIDVFLEADKHRESWLYIEF